MPCEYDDRCLNRDKCYRCFDLKLLKLPEDKKKEKLKNKTKKTYDKEDSWKDLEEVVANKLNNIPTIKEARRSIASGALWFEKGDIVDSILHPECKERKGRELMGGDKTISIHKSWIDKAKAEAKAVGKILCLPFRYRCDESIFAVMDFDDIAELVNMMKAYTQENEMQRQEIKYLKEELRKVSKEKK